MLDAQDEPAPLDTGFAAHYLQRGQNLEIRSEDRGEIRVAPQPCEQAAAQFAGDPVGGGQVVGAPVAAGVADDDVLVIREPPDVGFLRRKHLPANLRRQANFRRVRTPTAP